MTKVDWSKRWRNVRSLLEKPGPFQRAEFEPSQEVDANLQALMGFAQIHVIDMDTIDVSNLNRQFLFRPHDIGKPKAEVAAQYIMRRVPGCKVTPHYKQIQDFGEEFYRQFNVVVCGLDSVVARRWINSMLASMVTYNEDGTPDPNTVIPLVDGGTEGFKGHVLVVVYGVTGCLECTLDLYPPQVNFPLCTIAHTPRLPEHCIEYVRLLLWSKENPFGENVAIDGDSPEHIQWIHDQSVKRAQAFGITGVTLRLVQGVVKRIIPAVASTNAVVAAACATEVFKLVTFCYNYLDNYMNFSDLDGVYTYTFSVERKVSPTKLDFASGRMLIALFSFEAIKVREPSWGPTIPPPPDSGPDECLSWNEFFIHNPSKPFIIDVRSPAEFSENHIPNAVNIAVLNDYERAHVGRLHSEDRLLDSLSRFTNRLFEATPFRVSSYPSAPNLMQYIEAHSLETGSYVDVEDRFAIESEEVKSFSQMRSPNVTTVADGANKSLFIDLPEFADVLRQNLSKTLAELHLSDGQMLQVSDSTTPRTRSFRLRLNRKEVEMHTD
ncbi:hypothetical protein AHF37_01285 [Paragonimus kellicotti]|nr:hypothetical protein AHF37_01285 [Paragonimus kellicotti]